MTKGVAHSMCPKCHFGKLIMRQTTFASMFEGQLLVVPNTLVLVCDVCGETIVDQEMLHRLSGLLANERPISRDIPSTQLHT
jgi:YgiT-type zinc finger domain-containing protein